MYSPIHSPNYQNSNALIRYEGGNPIEKSLKSHMASHLLDRPVTIRTTIIDHSGVDILKELGSSRRILILSDLDLTLIKPKSLYGGGPLYDWIQNRTIERFDLGKQEAITKTDALTKLLADKGAVVPVQKRTPALLKDLQEKGIVVLGCTARQPGFAHNTLKDVGSVGIQLGKNGDVPHGLLLDGDEEHPKAQYLDGIVFAGSHLDKGKITQRILGKTGLSFDRIVLIDDQRQNLKPMAEACERMSVPFIGIRYGAADDLAEGLTDEMALEALKPVLRDDEVMRAQYQYLVEE